MNTFNHIQTKLQQFIKKYYLNELIKGLLLFFCLGLLYFIFTLLIEYFLWLKPTARTVLFVCFVLVEMALFIFYILIPIFKIWGLKKGINQQEAAVIIGNYFPEVKDKLLNMLQLRYVNENNELIEASIEQKSSELQFVSFKNAIHFSKNKKYIKYALIPIVICGLFYITGNSSNFKNSLNRVVHYQTQFEAPAPFAFKILNPSLNVIEGESFTLEIETVGNVVPQDAKIYFNNESYYLQNNGFGKFSYTFSSLKNSIDFFIESGEVVSKNYVLTSIATPVIQNFKMVLNFPKYTGKQNAVIFNTGNAVVPSGTNISWQVETYQADQVTFNVVQNNPIDFIKSSKNYYNYTSQIFEGFNYAISTSNAQLKNHEQLDFTIQVISDQFPKIIVNSDIDSITNGPVQFFGQISDDYGLNKVQLVYYNKNLPNALKTALISVPKSTFAEFYYIFPNGLEIENGIDYEFYFEVFDNDAINGSKRTKSKTFSYYNKTVEEVNTDLLKDQNNAINSISKSLENAKKENSALDKFKKDLQKKSDINWNDTKKLEDFLKRQNQYQELFQKQTKQLEDNLKEQTVNDGLKEKEKDLEKRIEETKKLVDQQKKLDELKKLTEKLAREDLMDKLDEITKENKRNTQSLDRILELTKRFYVEQKMAQINDALAKLAKKQHELSNQVPSENTSEKQNEINEKFNEIKNDFNELDKQNQDLLRPMKLPNNNSKKEEIDQDLKNAFDELSKQDKNNTQDANKSNAQKSQKSAAKKMQKMSQSLEQSMAAMEGESIDENIEELRKIVENVLKFSFEQEALMSSFSGSDSNHPEYPNNLKKQYVLKEYFEHIDDSIYMMSLRLVKMGAEIQKNVSDVYYNIDNSLDNFSDQNISQGISNQRFVITAANNLANQLSDLLENLMNASSSMGKGNGNQQQFTLPDIIQKQGELTQKMKDGMKKGEKPGEENGEGKDGSKSGENGEGNNEQMNSELYEIYKQQNALRQALNEMIGDENGAGKNGNVDAIKKMEVLEKELLEKGFSNDVIQSMQRLNYELLKLEKAKIEQGQDSKRTSNTNIQTFEKHTIDSLKLQNRYFNNTEILNRQSLPLRLIYKIKVQEYFKKEE
ncbi:hypothetical protein EC396_00100 [Lutibacter sp. HS1-25]|uniref:DUF4175 family protein n=1 Tax=Lutibacter sp. HS1-25 TaxID=2485000 RepID=UPI0010101E7C|nr:DUF4175 family protein [Lutibacter sp. HS1-25]RXP64416.1 hypothetical protein EC396_00100 [Lutibacter sp. HS1-25]